MGMHMNRRRPAQGEDLDMFLSGVINDAIRDAREAGLDEQMIWGIVTLYARTCDPTGMRRVYDEAK